MRDRLLGILFSQTVDIIDRGIGTAEDLNFGCQVALGFRKGSLDIMRKLGRGGQGDVFLAHDPNLDLEVAIKVLLADYRSEEMVGRFTTEEEIDYVLSQVRGQVERLRELSPLWDMYKDGIDLKSVEWVAH